MNDESMTLAQVRARLAEADLMEREIVALKDRIRGLQSQLAWTPVSDGLPTEPGHYLFASNGAAVHAELVETGSWFTPDGAWFAPDCERHAWTHYRRIELPNGD